MTNKCVVRQCLESELIPTQPGAYVYQLPRSWEVGRQPSDSFCGAGQADHLMWPGKAAMAPKVQVAQKVCYIHRVRAWGPVRFGGKVIRTE